jgi:hypothetical protein
MNWREYGRNWSYILRYYPVICLEKLRETTIYLRQDSQFSGQDFNMGPSLVFDDRIVVIFAE